MEAKIRALFKDRWSGDFDGTVEITDTPEGVKIAVYQMYDHPKMRGTLLETLQAISEITGMPEVNEGDGFDEPGCETCDYYSKYGFQFFAFRSAK